MSTNGGFEFLIIIALSSLPFLVALFVIYWVVRVAVRHELRINPPTK